MLTQPADATETNGIKRVMSALTAGESPRNLGTARVRPSAMPTDEPVAARYAVATSDVDIGTLLFAFE